MPYIIVDLQGQATAGGYLQIDGGRQIELDDDDMIAVSVGTHHLDFSTQSTAMRNMSKLNVAVGNYSTAAWAEKDAVDGKITEYFPENGVMLFTGVSDGSGHVLDLPTYTLDAVSDEKYQNLTDIYNERIAAQEAIAAQEDATVGVELLLCFFLGALGGHKFYRKQFGMGLLYLITGGIFGIGWLIDTLKLLFKWIKTKF